MPDICCWYGKAGNFVSDKMCDFCDVVSVVSERFHRSLLCCGGDCESDACVRFLGSRWSTEEHVLLLQGKS